MIYPGRTRRTSRTKFFVGHFCTSSRKSLSPKVPWLPSLKSSCILLGGSIFGHFKDQISETEKPRRSCVSKKKLLKKKSASIATYWQMTSENFHSWVFIDHQITIFAIVPSLVGVFKPSEKDEPKRKSSPNRGENKQNIWNHHPVLLGPWC